MAAMHFLELPIRSSAGNSPLDAHHRSTSQTNFIVEEDARSDITDLSTTNVERKGSSASCEVDTDASTNKGSISSGLFLLIPTKLLKCGAGAICILIFILIIAVASLGYLYFKTFAPYEICRTKECTRTATLFLRTMDDSIDPCEDFHRFACGNWITDTSAVANVAQFDHTTIMRNRIIGHLRDLTESITRNDIEALQQMKIMYNSCIDLESIEAAGVKPVIELINRLIDPHRSIAKTLAIIHRETGQDYIFDISIGPSYYNSSINQLFIDQPELPIPKASFLYSPNIVQAYEKLMHKVFLKLGSNIGISDKYLKNLTSSTRKIAAFDKLFALSSTDLEEMSKPTKANLLTLKELNHMFSNQSAFSFENKTQTNSPILTRFARDTSSTFVHVKELFNWTEYVETLFGGLSDINITEDFVVNVNDIQYIEKLGYILVRTPLDELHMYLMWQLLYTFGKDMSREFRDYFSAFSAVVDGTESTPNRRTECVNLLDKSMPYAMTHKYVLRYVKHGIIEEARELVSFIVQSFKNIVTQLDWMDANTKARALLKADKVKAYLGYPKWLPDPDMVNAYYEGLKFTSDSFFSNMLTLMKWSSEKDLKKFTLPVDLTWTSADDSPAEADCFYDDELNAVTIPSGFLQEPFIGMGLRALDYGALGSVMGHEVTHGFDTEGRYSDETGRLNSWWSLVTLDDFVGKAQCFVDQYSSYWFPELGSVSGLNNTINGRRTLAENIADNGGVREAFGAYRLYINAKGKPEPRLPGLEKYTPEQIFFLSFAQAWCSYMNPTALMDMIETDLHSPPKYRILGPLSNFQEFSEVWQCSRSTRMNPEKKCVLWG